MPHPVSAPQISRPSLPEKTGYLQSDFRIFYLTNTEARDFQSHYHDFHKLLLFENGSLSYYIEGETYQLQPWDLVLVPAGQVHHPVIHSKTPYCRLIVYISPAFLEHYRRQGVDLYHCFSRCAQENSHILRMKNFKDTRLYPVFLELVRSAQEAAVLYDSRDSLPAPLHLYQKSVLLQFMLLVSHLSAEDTLFCPAASGSNTQILQALSYINLHLAENLSVDQVAASCFLTPSYLMHLFRKETGYTILSYITEKRLFAARTLIQSGVPVTEACLLSGFQSYSSFYRAYQKKFRESPKNSRNIIA